MDQKVFTVKTLYFSGDCGEAVPTRESAYRIVKGFEETGNVCDERE
jgi:hypothetical protein